MNPTTQSCEYTIKFTYFVYNTKPVTITTKDYLPIKENYYGPGDSLRVPFWYAKLLYSRGVIEPIKELLEYERRFSKALGDQKINTKNLIKVDPDFYFESYDYMNHVLKRDSQRKEKSKRLKEFKDQRQVIIMNKIRMGISKTEIACMTFEEILFYEHTIRAKNDPYCVFDKGVKQYDEDQYGELNR